jgi:tetratricopeptide (TPR) repeat protein
VNTDGKLEVRKGREMIFAKEIHSGPMQIVTNSFEYIGDNKDLSVWLNNKLLYDVNREKYLLKRPVESPAEFNWETAYGHYLKGKEHERQRLYKAALEEYEKVLEVEPWFVPALTGIANLSYRKTEYQKSLDYSLKVLSVDTYDAEANMIYGMAGLALGDTTSALDGFSIASADISQRCAAYNALASVFLRQGDYRKSLTYAEKSLLYNQIGSEGIQLKIICLRKLGLQEKAGNELTNLEVKDPLNHFIRFERFITDPTSENISAVKSHISNELPVETYLEYAMWYVRNGQSSDALKILDLSPQGQPVVLLWKGYLNHLAGKDQPASVLLAEALDIHPQFVFPFRVETLKPLEWAESVSDSWKVKYYKGLIYLNAGTDAKAKNLWNSCGDRPDYYPFYIARSKLSDKGSQQALADVERAL